MKKDTSKQETINFLTLTVQQEEDNQDSDGRESPIDQPQPSQGN